MKLKQQRVCVLRNSMWEMGKFFVGGKYNTRWTGGIYSSVIIIPYFATIHECMSPNPHLDCSMRVKYFCVHLLDRILPSIELMQWKFHMFRTLLPSILSTFPAAMHTIFHWYVSMVRDRQF